MASGVYQLRCTVTGVRYVGGSFNLAIRKTCHFSKLRRGKHAVPALNDLVAANGIDSILFETLEECPADSVFVRERHWIQTTSPELNTRRDRIGGRRPIGRVHIPATLPRGMAEELSEAARERGWTRSGLIEELAREFLKVRSPGRPVKKGRK